MRVVVHVRRTDLVGKGPEEDGWPPTEPHYFNASMAYYRRLFKRVKLGYTVHVHMYYMLFILIRCHISQVGELVLKLSVLYVYLEE